MHTEFFQTLIQGNFFGNFPVFINGFWNDTRTISPGDCFLALKDKRDGHEFLPEAHRRGASCAIVQHINRYTNLPQFQVADVPKAAKIIAATHRKNCKIISVTGSYGKTSTKDILKLLFKHDAYATPENLNNELGITISLSRIDTENFGIIEAGIDHPGEMDPIIDLLAPDLAIVTGVTPVHVANFRNFNQLLTEKCKILHYASRHHRPCIFSESCLQYPSFREFAKECIVVGNQPNVKKHQQYTQFIVLPNFLNNDCVVILSGTFFHNTAYRIPAMTSGQVENFAKAATAAKIYGIGDDQIQECILTWRPSKMRGEITQFRGHDVYLDSYNANPAAMMDALQFFDQKYNGTKIYILGGMRELGNFSEQYHRQLAEYFDDKHDAIIFAIGLEMAPFHKKINKDIEVFYFSSAVDAKEDFLQTLKETPGAIFIKGSQYYHLSELLQ